MNGTPVNKRVLSGLLQCDILLHILFMYICEAKLRDFRLKWLKSVLKVPFRRKNHYNIADYRPFRKLFPEFLWRFGIFAELCRHVLINL